MILFFNFVILNIYLDFILTLVLLFKQIFQNVATTFIRQCRERIQLIIQFIIIEVFRG